MSKVRVAWRLDAAHRYDKDAKVFVAWCPAVDVRSQGSTKAKAKRALTSAVTMYIRICWSRSILDDILNKRGFEQCAQGDIADDDRFIDVQEELDETYPHTFEIEVPMNLIAAAQLPALRAQTGGVQCQ